MTQSLESVNAYSKAQSDLLLKSRKKSRFLDNDAWNEVVRALFSGQHVLNIAIKHGISDKTVYKWRKNVIDGDIPPRYRMTQETQVVVNQSNINFRDEGTLKPWVPNKFSLSEDKKMATDESFLDRLRQFTSDKKPAVQDVVEQVATNPSEHSTLLEAPSGDRFLTEVNDLQLMTFLKLQGFTLYQVNLTKI